MNQLASQSYKYQAIDSHPAHGMFKTAQGEYGDAIKCAKKHHWKGFLEEVTGVEGWLTDLSLAQ